MNIFKSYGAPSTSKAAELGDLYVDLNTGTVYKLTEVISPSVDLGFVNVYNYEDKQYIWTVDVVGSYPDLSEYLTEDEARNIYQPKGDYLTEYQKLKTINGQSLVGEGNIVIEGGSTTAPEATVVTRTAGTMIQNPTKLRGGIVDYIFVKPSFHSEIIGKRITKVKIYKVVDSANASKTTIKLGKVTITGDFKIESQTPESCATARAGMTSISTHNLSSYATGAVAELDCDITLGENEVFCFDITGGHCVGYCDDAVPVQEIMYVYDPGTGSLVCPQANGAMMGLTQHVPISVEYEEVEYADVTTQGGGYNPLAKFAGKKLSIVGDSISTFSGYIPSGYETFYPNSTTAQAGTGSLTSVEQTWWYKLCQESGMTLLKNASWSGSWVTGDTKSTTNAISASSDKRIADLKGSDGTTPDIIITYIGINDLFNSNVTTRGATLGNWTPDSEIPEEGNVMEFASAYAIMLKKIITAYPKAKVFCGTLLTTARTYKDTQGVEVFPTKHNDVTLNQVNNKIREIANGIGCNVIEVHNCGINYFNIGRYTIDMTHPNAEGATLIKNQMLAELIAKY